MSSKSITLSSSILIPSFSNNCLIKSNPLKWCFPVKYPFLLTTRWVSLFSILEEKEIQIRGFKVRLPLDIQFIFTSNPEDYTNRGTIVTPLKDRIGSQILTHYPESIEIAKKITEQESKLDSKVISKIHIPEIARDIIEQISFEARESELVDKKSGVSARMSITSLQNLVSSAERRMIINNEKKTSIRMSDFNSVISSINGKVELVYEGEEEGAEQVSYNLISDAVKSLFNKYFPKIEKLSKPGEETPCIFARFNWC